MRVIAMTPEQINMLPPTERASIIQLVRPSVFGYSISQPMLLPLPLFLVLLSGVVMSVDNCYPLPVLPPLRPRCVHPHLST